MNNPDIKSLPRIFRKYPDIQAVYVFGSMANKYHTHAESDLDLAILPSSASLRSRKVEILADLARQGFCNVDLIFLDTDDIVLKYEAIRQNQVVYYGNNFDRGAVYSKIVRQYLDFLPYLKVQRNAYKRRILSDTERSSP